MITMYDDINLSLIPRNAQAVAGYVNGRWPTFPEVVLQWPNAHHLSIAVTPHADAECLDVEPGDASNADAPAWVKRQLARGVRRPVVYTSVSNAPALVRTLLHAGIPRAKYRLWTAHYTGREHLCDATCGYGAVDADATQWTDRALGRSLDRTLCRDSFFNLPVPTPAPPAPRPPAGVFGRWADWTRSGGKWRRPGNAPARIPLEWWRRLAWENWAAAGRKGRRPNVPARIPASWWPHLKKFLGTRSK